MARTLMTIGVALASFMAGLACGIWLTQPGPPNPPPSDWTLIRVFEGTLDPQEGPVTAYVRVFSKASSGWDSHTLYQNEIEVMRPDGSTVKFRWPKDTDLAGGWCEVLDLDNDGRKEFVVFGDKRYLRVVSYSRSGFRFRYDADELTSSGWDAGPTDVDRDGRYEFVGGDIRGSQADPAKDRPAIKQWTSDAGFVDAPKESANAVVMQLGPRRAR